MGLHMTENVEKSSPGNDLTGTLCIRGQQKNRIWRQLEAGSMSYTWRCDEFRSRKWHQVTEALNGFLVNAMTRVTSVKQTKTEVFGATDRKCQRVSIQLIPLGNTTRNPRLGPSCGCIVRVPHWPKPWLSSPLLNQLTYPGRIHLSKNINQAEAWV